MIYAANNVSFSVLAVDEMSRHRVDLIKTSLRPVMEMTFEVFGVVQSGRSMGKAVIHMNPQAKVPRAIPTTTTKRFPANATYVIAGGLGGLGCSAARWMGARYLILLSRSGAMTSASQALLQELADKGVRVNTPKCEVTSLDALSTAFKECSESSARSSDNSLGAHQVIVGLLTPAQLQAQGIDPPYWLFNRGIFKGLPQHTTDMKSSTSTQPTGDTDLHYAFRKVDSAAAAIALVTEGLVQKLARALGWQ
ncbi:hypothetical protein N7540_007732 [Penicillium herquei]|nr:hypothetical protein N7540_007732 [Penicillium herquei]